MVEDRGDSRTFVSRPESATAAVASLVEPGLAVAMFVIVSLIADSSIMRPELTLCILVFALLFPGRNHFFARPLNAAVQVSATWVSLILILLLCGYGTRSFILFDWDVLVWWAVLTPMMIWLVSYAGHRWMKKAAQQADNRRSSIVIGGGPLGVKVAKALQSQGLLSHDFKGYFDDRQDDRLEEDARMHRLGSLRQVAAYIFAHGINEVYITLPLGSQPRIIQLLEEVQGTTASIYFVPDVFGISIVQGRLSDMNGLPVVGLCETPFTGINSLVKRVSDIVLSSLILILIAPVMLVIAAAVKLTSPGPVIFKQRRNGLDGQEIIVYKFRSMRTQDDGAVIKQATRDDPRITPLGAFLRRTSLDELPQFINVLQGRMSIVGPRPHAVAHNAQYRQLIKAYMVRHKVKPGITGWAQVNGYRGETDTLDKMKGRVEFDLAYLRNWSLVFDLQIVARTIKLVFFDRKAY